jgi:hypothetical protein
MVNTFYNLKGRSWDEALQSSLEIGVLPEDALKHDVEEQSTEVCLDSKPHHIEHATDTNGDKATPGTECRSNPNGELNYMSTPGTLRGMPGRIPQCGKYFLLGRSIRSTHYQSDVQ